MAWIFKKDYQTTSSNQQIQNEKKIIVYPNPAINRLNLKIKTNGVLEYEVISILGKTLISGFIGPRNNVIDISELTSNLYLLKIDNQTFKFMKIK